MGTLSARNRRTPSPKGQPSTADKWCQLCGVLYRVPPSAHRKSIQHIAISRGRTA